MSDWRPCPSGSNVAGGDAGATRQGCFPRRTDDRGKTENRAAVRLVERGSGRGGGEGRSGCCAQAAQESEEGKERKDRSRGNLRGAAEAGARAFVFRTGWAPAIFALTLALRCRLDLQFD